VRSIYIDRGECLASPIGAIIDNGTRSGELVASSTMGLTIFDLFREIMSDKDMKYFLLSHGIKDRFDGNSLALRCLLLLIDLSGVLRFEVNSDEDEAVQETSRKFSHFGENKIFLQRSKNFF
jgi:hypothetical protein